MTPLFAPNIFVIGTASLDVLHLAHGQTVAAPGGAGLYTALAAQKAGGRAGLFAPKPTPLPEPLQPVDECLYWLGPVISPDELPRLEIRHHGQGRATLVAASWGAEAQLTPRQLPPQLAQAAIIHIAALSTAARQLDFMQAIRAVAPAAQISVGTYARLVYDTPTPVHQLFAQADFFFLNENEATGLFGSAKAAHTRPGAILFVTLAANGALVITPESVTHVPGRTVPELDPTGAGDTFCGATLAGLVQGLSPVEAARQAVKLAAQTVGSVGPAALLATA